MKRQKITIRYLLKKLSAQSGEDKLRIAFKLSSFVNKIKSAGMAYQIQKLDEKYRVYDNNSG